MKPMIYKEKQCKAEILHEGSYKGWNFLIVSYGTHPCAYVETTNTRWAFLNYDALEDKISCHGGLTYADNLNHVLSEETNRWFIGWDYAHAGDFHGANLLYGLDSSEKKWTTEEIFEEVKNVIEQLEKLK